MQAFFFLLLMQAFCFLLDSSELITYFDGLDVELEAVYWSYGSPAIAHKQVEHLAHKPIYQINHWLYCAT